MELQQLRYFLAIIEHRTVHAASRALRISQSALTRSVQDLEKSLTVPLFRREAKRVYPTAVGLEFVHHARSVLRASEHAKAEATQIENSRSGDVRMGIDPVFSAQIVSAALRDASALDPALRLKVVEGHAEDLLDGLAADSLDFVFGAAGGSGASRTDVVCEPIIKSTGGVFLRASHPSASRGPIAPQDAASLNWLLLDHPQITTHFEGVSRKAQVAPPPFVSRTNSVALIKSVLLLGDFATCAHGDFLAPEIKDGRIVAASAPAFAYAVNGGLFYRTQELPSSAAVRVMETLRQICRVRGTGTSVLCINLINIREKCI